MIQDRGDWIDLDVVVEKYKTKLKTIKGSNGKPMKDEEGKALKEQIQVYNGYLILSTGFAKDGITLCGKVSNERNQVLKTRATIFDKYSGKFYIVKHSKEEIDKYLDDSKPYQAVGFQMKK